MTVNYFPYYLQTIKATAHWNNAWAHIATVSRYSINKTRLLSISAKHTSHKVIVAWSMLINIHSKAFISEEVIAVNLSCKQPRTWVPQQWYSTKEIVVVEPGEEVAYKSDTKCKATQLCWWAKQPFSDITELAGTTCYLVLRYVAYIFGGACQNSEYVIFVNIWSKFIWSARLYYGQTVPILLHIFRQRKLFLHSFKLCALLSSMMKFCNLHSVPIRKWLTFVHCVHVVC